MKISRFRLTALCAATNLALLSGCASISSDEVKQAGEQVRQNYAEQIAARNSAIKAQEPLVVRVSQPFIGSSDTELTPDADLPAPFHHAFSWTNNDLTKGITLAGAAQLIQKQFGVRVRILPEVFLPASSLMLKGTSAPSAAAPAVAALPVGLPGMPPGTPMNPGGPSTLISQAAATRDYDTTVDLQFSKNLFEWAESVSTKLGIAYRYDRATNELTFYRFDSRTFTLRAAAGTYAYNSSSGTNLSSASGDSSSASSSNSGSATAGASTSITGQYSVWDATVQAVASMMTGSRAPVPNQGTGTITVTDTVDSLRNIERYIRQQNEILNRKAVMRVQFYRIALNRTHQIGAGADLVYSRLLNANPDRVLKTSSAGSLVGAAAGSSSFTVLGAGSLAGSSLNLSFLNEIGTSVDQFSQDIPVLNFRQTTVNLYQNEDYLAKTSPAAGGTGTGSGVPGLSAAIASSGTLFWMHPAIYEAGDMNLRLSFNRSTAPIFSAISTGAGSTLQQIQLRKQGGIALAPELSLRNGETAVLLGVTQDSQNENSRNSLTSISRSVSGAQELQLILITPQLDGSSINSASSR